MRGKPVVLLVFALHDPASICDEGCGLFEIIYIACDGEMSTSQFAPSRIFCIFGGYGLLFGLPPLMDSLEPALALYFLYMCVFS